MAAAPTAGVLIIPGARQAAPALAVLPTTAAIHQEVVLEERPVTPVVVIAAAAIMACIDGKEREWV
ncbi:MAG: hypothetical protein B7Z37_08750 [Verrucomicrobia bacterium 12-59-8]|nr:MAG: hypothetical protein B7Z37_08750 [Verrucomicrobia bacterium 12-59-8]